MTSNENEKVSDLVDAYFAHVLFIHNMTDEEFDAYMQANYPCEESLVEQANEQENQ